MREILNSRQRHVAMFLIEVGWAAKTESTPFVLDVEGPPYPNATDSNLTG